MTRVTEVRLGGATLCAAVRFGAPRRPRFRFRYPRCVWQRSCDDGTPPLKLAHAKTKWHANVVSITSFMDTSLKAFLMSQPPGSELDREQIEFLLAETWPSLLGSRNGGMQAHKIRGRTEDLSWNPPMLSFEIERHGGTVNGSTRAEMQRWCVDVAAHTAEIVSTRKRQLHAMAKRVNAKAPAALIAEAILNDHEHEMLKRYPDGRVKVLISALFPHGDDFKQTVAGRRKRFRAALEVLIKEQGWAEAGTNTYQRRQAV